MTRLSTLRWFLASGCVIATIAGSLIAAERSSSAMAGAAAKFLASLTPDERRQASCDFGCDERLHWHSIPTGPAPMFPRNGMTIKAMTESQRKLAHDLLKTGLSQRGSLTASSMMDLEAALGGFERAE